MCNAKLKIAINRSSIERTYEDEPRLHSAAAHTPSTKSKPSYTSVECTLTSANKYQPKELFGVTNTVQKTRLCNLKRKIKTPTNFGKCLNCATGILGLSKRFQTLASTDWLIANMNSSVY